MLVHKKTFKVQIYNKRPSPSANTHPIHPPPPPTQTKPTLCFPLRLPAPPAAPLLTTTTHSLLLTHSYSFTLTHSLTPAHLLTFMHSLSHSLLLILIHSLLLTLTHLLTLILTHSFIHSYSPILTDHSSLLTFSY